MNAVFTWKGDLPSDDEVGTDPATRYSGDFGEQWEYQACQPVAVAIKNAVQKLGHKTDAEAPYFGEHGWHFGVRVGQQDFSIRVQWIPRGNRIDSFAVQPSIQRGCLAGLFLPQASESELQPVHNVLDDALKVHPLIADLEWVSEIAL